MRSKKGARLEASHQGELRIVFGSIPMLWSVLLGVLTLGGTRARVESVLYATFLVYSLEVSNPFSKEVLLPFLEHKELLLRGLLDRNLVGKRVHKQMEEELKTYLRSSRLQLRVIEKMQKAIRCQKKVDLIGQAKEGIESGLRPLLTPEGQSGTYFIRGEDRKILGIFKPFDEEMGAPNNPLGPIFQGALGQRRVRKTARIGESAHHEVGAYLVDHFFGFGLIPPTYYASFESEVFYCNHENRLNSLSKKVKYGSFQKYIEGYITLPMANDQQLEAISVFDYQMLMVLDVIIGNLDRNPGNLFIGEGELAAIDHGLAFPDSLKEPLSSWWWEAPIVKESLLDSSLFTLLKSFPFDELAWKLRGRCFIELPAIARMRERLTLFTEGVSAGLVSFRLSGLMTQKYLAPLLDLHTTLPHRAKEIVRNYVSGLKR